MLFYRVKINNTFTGLSFDFLNWDDATNFMGMAIDYGKYTDVNGEEEGVKVTVEEVDL